MQNGRRVVYLCMWTGESGGIQVLYEHVRLLRVAGFNAVLGSHGRFERCTWFANDAREAPGDSDALAALTSDDVLVVPEICIGAAPLEHVAASRVAFVQNPDLIGGALDGYAAAIVPTSELVPWLQRVSPACAEPGRIPIYAVPGFLHHELNCAPRRFTRKRPRVLLIDRNDKHRGEPALLRERLQEDANLAVTYVHRAMSRQEFTGLFREHDIYLHLSYPEGFPISILEAFGAGCLVIGFTGCGGAEFMRDGENCLVAADGDSDGIVAKLKGVLRTPPEHCDEMLRSARETAASYPEEATAAALQVVFRSLLGEGIG